jgi:hypothetical protein
MKRFATFLKKYCVLLIAVVILLLLVVFPYARVEFLSVNAEEKLKDFDLSCFDNVYCEGTPQVYDLKLYSYREAKSAKALYVFGDCEFGVMVELAWNRANNCWDLVDGRNMWTTHGGSAQEFFWPLYYMDKVYPLLDNSESNGG